VHFAAASRSGQLITRERNYGNLGRTQVRRASVIEALLMLGELASAEAAPAG
jgi:nicotinamide-nucleotide amidase